MIQYLYRAGQDIEGASPELLGGKGYGLHEMIKQGIPVPPAFIISTDACREYMKDPEGVMKLVKRKMLSLILQVFEEEFGYSPLLSVRSGAKDSMPGMMDTILNVGLSSENREEWTKRLGEDCANDSWCRLVEMYANVVHGIDRKVFAGASEPHAFGERYKKEVGSLFPLPNEQLLGAIEAVFKSWNNERAKTYRKLNGIPEDLGTAVVIQAMVFGNMNEKSGTGVAFSRDFSTGENVIVGDFLQNGQGEDVVAGIRNTEPLSKMAEWNPKVSKELNVLVTKLEKLYRDMVDVEFTVQDGKLYMLQVRKGKRTAQAALRIAVEMAEAQEITREDALERVTLKQFLKASRPTIPSKWIADNAPHGVGIPASNGCATGVAVFSSEAAINCKGPCILIAEETTPDDIGGMNASVGILTSKGGATSHAAVVGRGMDKVCVVGCLELEKKGAQWVLRSKKSRGVVYQIKQGVTKVTIDGATGAIWIGLDVPVEGSESNDLAPRFMDILRDKYKFYEIVTKPEELVGVSRALIATYLLDREYSGAYLDAAMRDMMNASSSVKDVVVDLRTMSQICREADEPLEFMWGAIGKEDVAIDTKISAMIQTKKEKAIKVLALGLQIDQIQTLRDNGFIVVDEVSTLPALLNASGLCVADFDKLLKVMDKEDVMKVVALKKAAGEEIRSFNIVQEIEPKAMKRSALFALSAMQAVQSVLAGN